MNEESNSDPTSSKDHSPKRARLQTSSRTHSSSSSPSESRRSVPVSPQLRIGPIAPQGKSDLIILQPIINGTSEDPPGPRPPHITVSSEQEAAPSSSISPFSRSDSNNSSVNSNKSLLSKMWTNNSRINRSGRVTPTVNEKQPRTLSAVTDFTAPKLLPYNATELKGNAIDHNAKSYLSHGGAPMAVNPFQIKKNSDQTKVHSMVETLFFRDNVRSIDYILVYKDDEDEDSRRRRKEYEQNLVDEGLELEKEDKTQSQDGETYFVKVHAPWEILTRYAEILKIKKPIKGYVVVRDEQGVQDLLVKKRNDLFTWLGVGSPFDYDENLIPPEPNFFSTGFSVHRTDQFIIKDRDSFFSPAQRSQIVWEILIRVRYSTDEESGLGVNVLLNNGTYKAAYMLHDGSYSKDRSDGTYCDRRILYQQWANYRKWYKKQPLHLIRRYFGDKMAMYFAWLGFYTQMLIIAASIGCFTFVCGLFFMNSDYNKPSEEICYDPVISNLTMCPLCDQLCDFGQLKTSCGVSKLTFMVDNPVTVIFSIAMSFWATMFLELWKRRQSVLQWQWDLENYEEEEEVRPEFQEKAKRTRINPVTKKNEPYMPMLNKAGRYVAANSLVLFMVMIMLAAVVAVMIYRMVIAVTFNNVESPLFKKYAKVLAAGSAAFLNLCIIVIFNFIYRKVAIRLTNLECPRTETEYEDSITLKIYVFQCINFYASLVYIAFFKGRFFFHPGDSEARKGVFQRLRYDMCDVTGCLPELCLQLLVIMVGKQLLSNFMEIGWPVLRVWFNKRYGHDNAASKAYTRWEQDYDLAPYTRLSLFDEYLEMVIQYGFVTLFVTAFPLAPLFALINNVIEIRLDAYKYLTKVRRPRPERIQDIGIWYNILRVITYMSVLVNALVISYTSDFIPRLVYIFGYGEKESLEGYVENILAVFNTSDYQDGMGPSREAHGDKYPATCRYRAYRYPPEHEEKYELNLQFWHVFTARLAFIFVFEHTVIITTGLLAYLIPDVPAEVKVQMQREKQVEKETLFETEMKRIREERQDLHLEPPRTRSPSFDESKLDSRNTSPLRNDNSSLRRSASHLLT